MNQISHINHQESFVDIFHQMETLFGNQDHFPLDFFLEAAKRFPDFIQTVHNHQQELVGHLCYIPFNQQGYDKMTSPLFSEQDIKLSDLFDTSNDSKMFLFAYSIYSPNPFIAKKLLAKTVQACQKLLPKLDPQSLVFAEIVSPSGMRMAKKMNMKESFRYKYAGQSLIIYECFVQDYVRDFPLQ